MKYSHIALLLSTMVFAPLAGAATADTGAIYDAATPPPTARCVGTNGTAVACVDTSTIKIGQQMLFTDCIYTGGPTCTTVRVTAPKLVSGPGVTLQCGYDGPDANCVPDLK